MLVVSTANVILAWPLVRFHVAGDQEGDHHSKRGKQHREFKGYRNERGKGSVILATDDHRPVIAQHPYLCKECQRCTSQSKQEGSDWKASPTVSKGLVQSVYGERRIHLMNLDTSFPHRCNCAYQHVFIAEDSQYEILIVVHGSMLLFGCGLDDTLDFSHVDHR